MNNPKRTALHEGHHVDPSENLSRKSLSSKTHTLQLINNPNDPDEPLEMPLRIKIRDEASGDVFTIQAVPGGIRVSVEQGIILRPNATNAIEITATNF